MHISDAACQLFNRAGFMATSFRGVASALGMSPGHLNYHFKNKAEILDTLFLEIVAATETMVTDGGDPADMPRQWFALQRRYFFFFRELPALLLAYPSIRRRFRAIGKKRMAQFAIIFRAASAAGLVIAEPEPGFFDRFAELLWQHSNSSLALLSAAHGARSMAHAESLLHVLLLPLLTPLGRESLHRARS